MIGDLDALFEPHTVAVVGAGRDGGKMGNLILRNLAESFHGELLAVHPAADRIDGIETHPSVAALPNRVDLLISLIPASELLDLVRACPPGKVGFLLAISSGFGEAPPQGPEMEAELVAAATKRGMRVIGPNTLGVMSPAVGLAASLAPPLLPRPGGFSCVTQSGGFGMAVYMYSLDHGLGVSRFCDVGNTADVSIAEVIGQYAADPSTAIIGAFLESWPTGLAESVTAAASRKPVILTSLGRTVEGRAATVAHLGVAGGRGDQPVVPSASSAPINAWTGLEMLDIAKAMAWQPAPRGRRVGILTGSGGIGTELVDLCIEHGLEVPELSPGLQERLRPHLPPYASVSNPVDLTPIWPSYPEVYPPLMDEMLSSGEIDILVVTVIDMATALPDLMAAVTNAVHRHRTQTDSAAPVLAYWVAPPDHAHHRRLLEDEGVPCYSATLTVARVAAALARGAVGESSDP